jgi:hypothetical protein
VDDVLPFDDDKRDAIIDRSKPRMLRERIAGRAYDSILPMVDHEASQPQYITGKGLLEQLDLCQRECIWMSPLAIVRRRKAQGEPRTT